MFEYRWSELLRLRRLSELRGNSLGCVLLLAALGSVASHVATAADAPALGWPNWQGPQQNHQSTEKGLVDAWSPAGGEGSNLLWKRGDLGTRSTPVVFNGKLYVLTRHNPGTEVEQEKVVCLDAATGNTLWEHRFNVYLSEVPDTRVAWSNCAVDPETGRVYAQGVCGSFFCLDGESGEVVWSRALHEEFGTITTYGGRTNVPVVFEDLVLISAVVVGWGDTPEFGGLARPAHRFMAFDKATGELRWLNGTSISPYDTTYSTPSVAVIGGVRQLVFCSGDGGVWGMQPRTGVTLWNYPFSRAGIHMSPLVVGDVVYASHSEENTVGTTMGAVAALDGTQRGEIKKPIWQSYEIMAGRASPLVVDGKLWIVDDRAKLYMLDPATGRQLGKKALGTGMRSTPIAADGKVFACTASGRWYILKPNGNNVQIVHRLNLNGEANDGSPVIAEGRIYLPTSDAIYCLGSGKPPQVDPLPPGPEENPLEKNPELKLLQLAPYDALLKPGESQQFTVRLYNSDGQLVETPGDAKLEFAVKGPGTVSAEGVYTAATDAAHTAALVTCKLGELAGSARVRIVPALPWKFDFNDGDVPISWIGGRVRYVPKEVGGEKAILKRNLLPTPRDPHNKLGTRSQLSMGPSDLHDYTIQADVYFMEAGGNPEASDAESTSGAVVKLPDAGLSNSGYSLTMRSLSKQLRLYSWSAHEYRTFATADFDVQPNVWYRMKLRVEQRDGEALVQGKMWPRDEEESAAWTVEMTDKSPQKTSSPGLFGNTQDAEFAFDNVIVTPNE